MDAIQEFRVLDNTSAEFGRSSGSNVNIVIKSGTRNLHGSAYEYLRNDKFDANDFFANKQNTGKVPFRQNQYGVAVGRPGDHPEDLPRPRQDVLVLQLGRLSRAPGSNQHQQFPDRRPQRDGDFSALSTSRSTIPFTGVAGPNGVDRPAAVRRQHHPRNLINPAMKFWLDTMIPLPNRPGLTNNFVNTQGFANDRDAIKFAAITTSAARTLLSVRWSRQRVGQNQPGGNPYL